MFWRMGEWYLQCGVGYRFGDLMPGELAEF